VGAVGKKAQQALLLRRRSFGTRNADYVEAMRTRRLGQRSFDFGGIAQKSGF
jgi:hypothetical protein